MIVKIGNKNFFSSEEEPIAIIFSEEEVAQLGNVTSSSNIVVSHPQKIDSHNVINWVALFKSQVKDAENGDDPGGPGRIMVKAPDIVKKDLTDKKKAFDHIKEDGKKDLLENSQILDIINGGSPVAVTDKGRDERIEKSVKIIDNDALLDLINDEKADNLEHHEVEITAKIAVEK